MVPDRKAPVAIVDIGSNSVRLVVFESLTRSPIPVFNEKVLCGLGKGVATTGLLADDAMRKALAALRNFRALCRNMAVEHVSVLATAATRDARNGASFLAAAAEAIGTDVVLIDGQREAALSALGIRSSFHEPDGVAGDLGGGSLELIDVGCPGVAAQGMSLPIGGLALQDLSGNSLRRAQKIVREALDGAGPLRALRNRTFYAVGGTWRALARLHMRARSYPLDVMHGYLMPAGEAGEFARLLERSDAAVMASIGAVHTSRRPLLPFGAVVLDEVIRIGRPKAIAISAAGVREGLLFERLGSAEQRQDPLIEAARQSNRRRSRDPHHGEDLCAWTDRLVAAVAVEESDQERRLRHAACLLADTAWRSHPDYRATYAVDTIACAAFVAIDHAERAFLALTIGYRHTAAMEELQSPLRTLLPARLGDRARLIALAMRVAYLVSSATGGVLPRTAIEAPKGRLVLRLGDEDRDLASERVASRLRQLARHLGRDGEVLIGDRP